MTLEEIGNLTPQQIVNVYYVERDRHNGGLVLDIVEPTTPTDFGRFSDYYKSIGLTDPEFIKSEWEHMQHGEFKPE